MKGLMHDGQSGGIIAGHITGQTLGHKKQFTADNAFATGHVHAAGLGFTDVINDVAMIRV